MKKYHVVFHIDEHSKGRADQALRNIENLLNDLGQDHVEIELVANGGAVKEFVKGTDSHADQVEKLVARGVNFVVCANSLNILEINKELLLESVHIVPAGVGELVRKQADGWGYIKP